MPIDNIDALLHRMENPRDYTKTERDQARQELIAHAEEAAVQLHLRIQHWFKEFSSADVRTIDQRCQQEANDLKERLGSINHPSYLAEYAQLPAVRFRNVLDIREATAISLIDLLCELGQSESIEVLKNVIHGPWRNEMTWFTAAKGLVKMGDPEGVEYMKERILDPQTRPGMRRAVCRNLCEWGISDIFTTDEPIPGDPSHVLILEEEYMPQLRRS